MVKSEHKIPVVLLVEDDIALQTVLELALSDEGFKVVVASNGSEGLARLQSPGAAYNALVTDIRLGAGTDGWELGRHARETVTGIPVIYMSGDSAHEWSINGVPESVMLQKPFAMAQLITALSNLLNQVISGPPSKEPEGKGKS